MTNDVFTDLMSRAFTISKSKLPTTFLPNKQVMLTMMKYHCGHCSDIILNLMCKKFLTSWASYVTDYVLVINILVQSHTIYENFQM